jgi:hypothetical protein
VLRCLFKGLCRFEVCMLNDRDVHYIVHDYLMRSPVVMQSFDSLLFREEVFIGI